MNENEMFEMPRPEAASPMFRLATVTALFPTVNTAKIKFDGEDVASEKQYPYLSSYAPVVNDRVLVLSISGTYIILGKILYNTAPKMVVQEINIKGNLDHDGAGIGLFNGTVVGKSSVSDPSSLKTTETAPSTYTTTAQNMLNHIKTDLGNMKSTLNAVTDLMQWYTLG